MSKSGLITLQVSVSYDRSRATEDEVCAAMNKLLETATSTPSVLSEVGDVRVGDFEILMGNDVDLDEDEADDDGSES